MAHFVTIQDAIKNNLPDNAGQFTDNPLPGHECVPECHEIGGESEAEIWANIRKNATGNDDTGAGYFDPEGDYVPGPDDFDGEID